LLLNISENFVLIYVFRPASADRHIDELVDTLECPVCLDTADREPIYQCPEGRTAYDWFNAHLLVDREPIFQCPEGRTAYDWFNAHLLVDREPIYQCPEDRTAYDRFSSHL
jgi:hypothetical protein